VLVYVPTLLLAVIQSYRLFRAQLQGSTLSVVRNLLPLALMAFLCTFPFSALDTFVFHAWNQKWKVEFETLHAIGKIQPDTAKLDATHPLQLTPEDLAKAFPLSEDTRRWLRGSRITIAPLQIPPDFDWWGKNSWKRPAASYQDYLATIHFAGGSDCSESFWQVPYPNRDLRMLVVICK